MQLNNKALRGTSEGVETLVSSLQLLSVEPSSAEKDAADCAIAVTCNETPREGATKLRISHQF